VGIKDYLHQICLLSDYHRKHHEFSVQFWYKNKGHRAPYNRVRNQNSARTDGILLQAGRERSFFGMISTTIPSLV
jgi:hypothetical protein